LEVELPKRIKATKIFNICKNLLKNKKEGIKIEDN